MEQSFYNCAQNVVDDGNLVVYTTFVSLGCCCCCSCQFLSYLFHSVSTVVQFAMDVWSADERMKMHIFFGMKLWLCFTFIAQTRYDRGTQTNKQSKSSD